jgi:hypothetical protein
MTNNVWEKFRAPRLSGSSSRLMIGVVLATSLLGIGLTSLSAGGVTVGDPQPELAQFPLGFGGDTSSASGTVLANGNIVLASPNTNGTSLTECVVRPGFRKCSSKNDLRSFGGDDLYGSAVVTTGGANVEIVAEDDGTNSGTDFPIIVYNSSNGGQSFSAPVVVSTLYGVSSATATDGTIVIATNDPHLGLVVQSIDPTGNSVQSDVAVLSGTYVSGATVSSYDGGVLVAGDNLSTTKVWYAPAGSDFSNSADYSVVGTFAHQLVAGLSGRAVLTTPTNSISTAGIISIFNGSSFGPAFKVPDSKAGDDGYFSFATTGPAVVPPSSNDSGDYHVFFEGRRDSYDLIEESTTNGTKWSAQTLYGSAVSSGNPVPVLGSTGAGLVFEADSTSQLAQPILNLQSVTISLSPSEVKAGVHDEIKGTAAPHISGHSVELQIDSSKGWNNVSSTHESASGAFTFSVPGKVATYRVVSSVDPGYFEFGYSNSVTVRLKP